MPAAFSALRWRLVAVACALGVGLGVGTSAGETYPVTPVSAPPIDTATRSCDELKSALRTAGALTLTSEREVGATPTIPASRAVNSGKDRCSRS